MIRKYRNPLTIAYRNDHDISSDVLLYAGADPTLELKGPITFLSCIAYDAYITVRESLHDLERANC